MFNLIIYWCMKQLYLKVKPKIFLVRALVTGVLVSCFIGCQKDDSYHDEIKTEVQHVHSGVSVSKVYGLEILKNQEVKQVLEKIKKNKGLKYDGVLNEGKYVTYETFNVVVDDSQANYTERDDGTYHSYTFRAVDPTNLNAKMNLILSLRDDGTYLQTLVNYFFTENELVEFNTTGYFDFRNEMTYEVMDEESVIIGLYSKEIQPPSSGIDCYSVDFSTCTAGGNHTWNEVFVQGVYCAGVENGQGPNASINIDLECAQSGGYGSPSSNEGTGDPSPGSNDSGGGADTNNDPDTYDGSDPDIHGNGDNNIEEEILYAPLEDDCILQVNQINSDYSQLSPFNVNLIEVYPCEIIDTSNVIYNQKFMCIYDKLTQSPKFKDLFIDTFGESESLNVTFKISDTLSTAGLCDPNIIYNPVTGQITSADIDIIIQKTYLQNSSAIAVAKTILHESIHAYLMLKQYGCEQGTPFEEWNDVDLGEILNEYFQECETLQGQHEFMFNFMVPTMSQILADIKDVLVPENHQQIAENELFINEEDPSMYPDGSYMYDVIWDWGTFYKYLSMSGLQNSSAFHLEIGVLNTPEDINQGIDNESVEVKNFKKYAVEIGNNMFKKECDE